MIVHNFRSNEVRNKSKLLNEKFIRVNPTPELPFYGRRAELVQLEESFSNCRHRSEFVFITGPPVIGKSELICEFMKHKCKSDLLSYSWIDCKNGAFCWYQLYYSLIRQNCRSVCIGDYPSRNSTAETESQRIVGEIIPKKYWVCILDNISLRTKDLEYFVYDFHNLSKIFVVIISRNVNLLNSNAGNIRHINLPGLDFAEILSKNEIHQGKEICNLLDGHPLGLHQFFSYANYRFPSTVNFNERIAQSLQR